MSETISLKKQVGLDEHWIDRAFFNASAEILGADGLNRIPDSLPNFYDTSLGGNRSINCPYQYAPTTDPRVPSLALGSDGMGDYYMEAIDNNATRATFTFGVPAYNSLARYLANYYDNDLATYATTGRMSSSIFSAFAIGRAVGFVLTLPFQAIVGVYTIAVKYVDFMSNTPYSKFAYFKPTMGAYWTAVSYLVNMISIDLDLQLGFTGNDYEETKGADGQRKVAPKASLDTGSAIKAMNALLPDIFKTTGGQTIDVRAVASKAQRLSDQYQTKVNEIIDSSRDFNEYVTTMAQAQSTMKLNPDDNKTSLSDYMSRYLQTPMGKPVLNQSQVPTAEATNQDGSAGSPTPSSAAIDMAVQESSAKNVLSRGEGSSFWDMARAELHEGSMFVSFSVDYGGSVSETFSNSTKPLSIKEQIAGAAHTSRDFAINAGNLFGLGGALDVVTDFFKGAASSLGLGSLASLGSGAFPDMQDTWDDSTASFGNETYTIKLVCPYPDPISYLQDIIVPMCCILAGGMARTSGKNSYVSPFLCQVDSIGRNRVTYGMIDNITITRGGSKVGWSNDNLPTEVTLSVSVKNLDTIMHVPVADGLTSTLTGFSLLDEENALTNYTGVLAGLSKYNTYYFIPRWKRRTGLWKSAYEQITSKSYWAQRLRYSLPGDIISGFVLPAKNLKNL